MLDAQTEVASDFSVFHRVDDPMQLPSSRYFDFAELLPSYLGAVRVALTRTQGAAQPAFQPAVEPLEDQVSPAALAAMSDHPDFPGIEFTGG